MCGQGGKITSLCKISRHRLKNKNIKTSGAFREEAYYGAFLVFTVDSAVPGKLCQPGTYQQSFTVPSTGEVVLHEIFQPKTVVVKNVYIKQKCTETHFCSSSCLLFIPSTKETLKCIAISSSLIR